jgi:hypothetical protein
MRLLSKFLEIHKKRLLSFTCLDPKEPESEICSLVKKGLLLLKCLRAQQKEATLSYS